MIVKFFKHGATKSGKKTAKSVKGYLLNKERLQAQTANIIRGDEQATSRLIDLCNQAKFSSTYTAGCLSFDEKESLTNEQKQTLMQSFEQALLPEFDPTRYACYWVEHTDKGRLELNFVFAKIDLATGKHLDVYQQRRDVARLNNWKEIQIQQYGLIDPNAPERERDFVVRERTIRRADGTSPADNYSQIKQEIDEYLRDNIELGYINNSDDIKCYIEFVNGDLDHATGYQVKQNKTGVSITDTTTQNKFRLQGKIYARDFTIQKSERDGENRIGTQRQERQARHDREQVERLERANDWYNKLSQQRAEQLNKKYGREPKGDRPSLSLATNYPNSKPSSKPTDRHLDAPEHENNRVSRADTDRFEQSTKPAPNLSPSSTRTSRQSPTRERGADNTDDYTQDTQPIHTRIFTGSIENSTQFVERTDAIPDTEPSADNRQSVSRQNRANQQYNRIAQQSNNRVQSDGQSESTYDTTSGTIDIFVYPNGFSTHTGTFANFRCFRFALVETANNNRVSTSRTHISRTFNISNSQTRTGIKEPNNEQRPLQLFEKCRSLIERAYRTFRNRRAKREQRLAEQKRERERQAEQRLAERDSQLAESHQRRTFELANGQASRDDELANTNSKINQLFERIGTIKERIGRATQGINTNKQRTSDTKRELDSAKQALAGAVKRIGDTERKRQQQRDEITKSVNIAIQSSSTELQDSPSKPQHPSRIIQDGNSPASTTNNGQSSPSQSIQDGSSELQTSTSRLRDSEIQLRESLSQFQSVVRGRVRGTETGIVGGIKTRFEQDIQRECERLKPQYDDYIRQFGKDLESDLEQMKTEYEQRLSAPRPRGMRP